MKLAEQSQSGWARNDLEDALERRSRINTGGAALLPPPKKGETWLRLAYNEYGAGTVSGPK